MTTKPDLREESRCLAERIVDTVPVTQLAFRKLLNLLDIKASYEVPSAGVSLGPRSRLLLNPDFVAEHCVSDQALMMLVLHELHHVLLGHTRLYEVATPAQNLVFDAVINAHLCQALPDPTGTALFRSLYQPDIFPEALLRPPAGWGTSDEKWDLTGAALEAHQALYSETSASYGELFELLEGAMNKSSQAGDCEVDGPAEGFATERLLGSHDEPTDETSADPALIDAVRNIVAKWPAVESCSGRDQGYRKLEDTVHPVRARRQAVSLIRRALLTVVAEGKTHWGVPGPGSREAIGVRPYRTLVDRRAEIRAILGVPTLFFKAETSTPSVVHHARAHLYLDVSGSMNEVLPLLYGALLPLMDRIHPIIHLFSTEVFDITSAQLREGAVVTNNGTDIACVTGHMLEHDVRRALIITDGLVGPVPEDHRKRLKRRRSRLAVVLTDDRFDGFVDELRARKFVLPAHFSNQEV